MIRTVYLFVTAALLWTTRTDAFAPLPPTSSLTSISSSWRTTTASTTLLRSEPPTTTTTTETETVVVVTESKRTGTYAQCGRCQSAFPLQPEDLGNGRGRRLECSVCGHSWFQSRDRLIELGDGFEMVPLPESDKQRIATNIVEGKSPKYTGEAKLYVGNISFGVTEDDLMVAFSDVGEVGSVALVRDEQGRNRGFGFITMRTKEGGDEAVEKMNGVELKGRNLAVRESNN